MLDRWGGGFICLWLLLATLNSEEFTLCSGNFDALVFPYIYDRFEWALIGDIEWQTVHSVLWQFRQGREGRVRFTLHRGKSENLSSFQVLLLLHRALSFL